MRVSALIEKSIKYSFQGTLTSQNYYYWMNVMQFFMVGLMQPYISYEKIIGFLRGDKQLKKVINKCLLFRIYAVKPEKQMTSQLSRDHIAETPIFNVTEVDFTINVYMKNGDDTVKSYIALFTCPVPCAVHLELASDLPIKKFILALRRFPSRRGNCRLLCSDNVAKL